MTYPGLEGQNGVSYQHRGWQVRQSHAGTYPGGEFYGNAGDADTYGLGTNTPTSAVAAGVITVEQEMAFNPHSIEAQNFELDWARDPDFGSPEDYTGRAGQAGGKRPVLHGAGSLTAATKQKEVRGAGAHGRGKLTATATKGA